MSVHSSGRKTTSGLKNPSLVVRHLNSSQRKVQAGFITWSPDHDHGLPVGFTRRCRGRGRGRNVDGDADLILDATSRRHISLPVA